MNGGVYKCKLGKRKYPLKLIKKFETPGELGAGGAAALALKK